MGKKAKVGTIVNKELIKGMIERYEWRTNGSMVVDIEKDGHTISLINIYKEPGQDREFLPRKIKEDIVLLGDINGHNYLWGSRTEDARGEAILKWIMDWDMDICNSPLDPPTFSTARAKGWVDLTIYKNVNIRKWKIEEDESLSDHKYITFDRNRNEKIKKEDNR